MRILCLFVAFGTMLMLNSCATLLNSPYTHVYITTPEPVEVQTETATFNIEPPMGVIYLERKHQPAYVDFYNDSTSMSHMFMPQNSFAFYANLLTNYGMGMIVDLQNPKRWAYPRNLYLDDNLQSIPFLKSTPARQAGRLYMNLELPYTNHFSLRPSQEKRQNSFGFMGVSGGFGLMTSTHTYVEAGVGAAIDNMIPFPAAVDYWGPYTTSSTSWVHILTGRYYKRFSLGMGIHYTKNQWSYYNGWGETEIEPEDFRPNAHRVSTGLGPLLKAGFTPRRSFFLSLLYKPVVFRFEAPNSYEHFISLGIGWQIKLANLK